VIKLRVNGLIDYQGFLKLDDYLG